MAAKRKKPQNQGDADDGNSFSAEQTLEAMKQRQETIRRQVAVLEERCRGTSPDSDADILFAYGVMARTDLMPLQTPTPGAWSWYLFAQTEPQRFLEIFAKREDAKAKAAGTITQTRVEDDRRKQFAILDRIERQLTTDVEQIIGDLMQRFPETVLLECRKHTEAWNRFFEKYPR